MRALPVGSVLAMLIWYAALLLVQAAAFPIAYRLMPRLSDRGFGLSRVLGVACSTWVLTLAVTRRLAPGGRFPALVCLALLGATGAAAFYPRRREILAFVSSNRGRLVLSEAVFLFGFALFTYFRAATPEIYWGEKPMDFSILNILVRTDTLPPSDPWFSGAPLRYYYFGQEMVAWLSLVTGLSTRFTFNLAFGFLGGATLQGAFSLLVSWTGRIRAGLTGAALLSLLGNVAGLREWLVVRRPKMEPLNWHYFWATSRVIPDTVNEYPFWSFLFADLHAHVLAIPLFLLFAASALSLVRAHADAESRLSERVAGAALLGFSAALQALTNAWDAPLLAGVLVLLPLVLATAPGLGLRFAWRAALSGIVSLSVAFGAARPIWPAGNLVGFGRNWEPPPGGVLILNVFGLFFFLAFAWWLVAFQARVSGGGEHFLSRRRSLVLAVAAALLTAAGLLFPGGLCLAGVAGFLYAAFALVEVPEDRLAFGFLGTAFFLVAFSTRFYIDSRFNTVFKLYYEAWLLLAVAASALAFGPAERRGSFRNWPWFFKAAAAGLFALAGFTTVSAARGYLIGGRPTPPGAYTHRKTLDGLAYLSQTHPGEYKAVIWLREKIRGTPVLVEAQGPSYREFGRISMYTGLPTVVGWSPHVEQRGNPSEQVESRRAAVDAIYSLPTAEATEPLLRRYHVGYVYVGWVERRTYPAAGLDKFDSSPGLYSLVYENPEARVYRVVGGDTQDVIAVRESAAAPKPETTEAAEAAEDKPEALPMLRDTPAPGKTPYAGLREPRDAAVDGKGRLFVADFGNSRLAIFDPSGGYLGGWGGRGRGPHGFNQLCGVAIRGDAVYVADTWNGRVEAFSLAGERRAEAGDLYGPRGVALSRDGRVWVSDTGNNRVVVYDADLKQLATFGKKGPGREELDQPVGITPGTRGRIYVADSANRRIQILETDGAFVGSWAVPGWTAACEPQMEADEDGTLYVADPTGDAVLVYEPSGRIERRLDHDASGRPFAHPGGIAISQKARILYVVNSGDGSVAAIPLPRRKGKE
jgi:YYY domain-containing protein